ncbi:isocitrate lyase/phosphoenolpyruvate mutase family protein [Actinophytocola sp.]|uniref:isocitrate lyase/PEP mutase family protein n=1 Tax=Actinophytocola sp. TaxID=1872138 RepID=UPI002D3EBB08|nr:isocitrate lyase/phosphoenolpyruvate mutase family protein [Actinophytocola sp.]HYQ64960.1 isocitrate lyase/phosphoenolpyruvate mutase family protein [Actinophytocola sp.]
MSGATGSTLRSLHVPGRPLVLPNVWDPGTARLVVEAGFPVVATSSAAVAESLGYRDHEGAAVEEMFAAARRITRAVDVPVTVDAEAGYGLPPGELAGRLLATGAVGCNLEDTDHSGGGLTPPDRQAEYLAGVRAAAGEDLVINARVDVFLHAADQSAALAEGVARARAYLDAGADCVYPILIRSTELLRSFVAEVGAPVNATLLPELTVPDLAAAGVARISLAAGLWRRTQAVLRDELRVVLHPEAQ